MTDQVAKQEQALKPINQQVVTANKVYDEKSGLLNGFDINFGANDKPLHVDLQGYSPQLKTAEETRHMRENFVKDYQSIIDVDSDKAERAFKIISHKFPEGISWGEPTQALKSDNHTKINVLEMRGNPSKDGGHTHGEQFLQLHQLRAIDPQLHSQNALELPNDTIKNLQGALATINVGENFTGEQKEKLISIMANTLNQNGVTVAEERMQNQSLDRTA